MSSPEPMSLGSPSTSPTQPAGNPNYLPQFLLDDPSSLGNPSLYMTSRNQSQLGGGRQYWSNTGASPPRQMSSAAPGGGFGSGQSLSGRTFSGYDAALKYNSSNFAEKSENMPFQSLHHSHHHHHNSHNNYASPHERFLAQTAGNLPGGIEQQQQRSGAAAGAPPVNRLVDVANRPSLGASPALQERQHHHHHHNSHQQQQHHKFNPADVYYSPADVKQEPSAYNPTVFLPPQQRFTPSPAPSSTFTSPAAVHDSYMFGGGAGGGEDKQLEETWITVFGFSETSTSLVLQEFASYGQILRHVPNLQGNWMHIQYQARVQAQKALNKNGKVIGDFMIGVMPCTDKKIMSESLPSPPPAAAAPSNSSPSKNSSKIFKQPSIPTIPSGAKLDRTQSLRTHMRPPLSSANRDLNAGPPSAATTDSIKMPKKNTNVFTQILDYAFGW